MTDKEHIAALERALVYIRKRAADHPSFDPELTFDELIEAGGDTCDWGIIYHEADLALNKDLE